MKNINNLDAISGGFATEGAVSATLVALPLALTVGHILGSFTNAYVVAGLTAATLVYGADLLKKCDKDLIQFGQSLLSDSPQEETYI